MYFDKQVDYLEEMVIPAFYIFGYYNPELLLQIYKL